MYKNRSSYFDKAKIEPTLCACKQKIPNKTYPLQTKRRICFRLHLDWNKRIYTKTRETEYTIGNRNARGKIIELLRIPFTR